jgi:hypothetical protein
MLFCLLLVANSHSSSHKEARQLDRLKTATSNSQAISGKEDTEGKQDLLMSLLGTVDHIVVCCRKRTLFVPSRLQYLITDLHGKV